MNTHFSHTQEANALYEAAYFDKDLSGERSPWLFLLVSQRRKHIHGTLHNTCTLASSSFITLATLAIRAAAAAANMHAQVS